MVTNLIAATIVLMTVLQGQANSKVEELSLSLLIQKKTVTVGEAIPVQINLTNNGPKSADVPANDGPTQFEYLLLDNTGSQTIESITHRKKELSTARGSVPNSGPLSNEEHSHSLK